MTRAVDPGQLLGAARFGGDRPTPATGCPSGRVFKRCACTRTVLVVKGRLQHHDVPIPMRRLPKMPERCARSGRRVKGA